VTDEERLELTRRSYAAWSAADEDGMVALFDPECEWRLGDMAAAVGADVHRGHDGLRRFMRDLTTFFDGMHGEIDEARADGERILVRSWVAGRSEAFGDVSQRQAQIVEFRGGRILRITQTEDPPPGWDEARPLP
jgi:ketosteroid isomerase-like protein